MKVIIYTEKIFLSVTILSFAFLPLYGLAAGGNWIAGPIVPCGTSNNPEPCTLCHLVIGFYNLFKWGLALLFTACILFITVAGVIYMVSSGNKALMDRAKKALLYSLTAFVLFLCSWLIVTAVMIALGYKQVGNWWTFECDTTSAWGVGLTGGGGGGSNENNKKKCNGQCKASCDSNEGKGEGICEEGKVCCVSKVEGKCEGWEGSCGGMKTAISSDQCKLASKSLETLLKCMSSKGAPGTITSVTANNVGSNCEKSYACCGDPSCTHATYTCHYGCGMEDQGYSHAIDIGTSGWSDEQLCQLASIAKECGSGTIWGPRNMCGGNIRYQDGHVRHLHISTGACNH